MHFQGRIAPVVLWLLLIAFAARWANVFGDFAGFLPGSVFAMALSMCFNVEFCFAQIQVRDIACFEH